MEEILEKSKGEFLSRATDVRKIESFWEGVL